MCMSGSKVAIHITYHTEKFSFAPVSMTLFLLPSSYCQVNMWNILAFYSAVYFTVKFQWEMKSVSLKIENELEMFLFCKLSAPLNLFLRILSKVTHENANIRNSSWMVCFCKPYYSFSSRTQLSEPMPSGKSLNDTFKELMGKHSRLEYLNFWNAWLWNIYHFSQSPMCVWQLNWAYTCFIQQSLT